MSREWVQFLRKAYPPEKLAEIPDGRSEGTNRRMSYLRDIYQVAQAEQEFSQHRNGMYIGKDLIHTRILTKCRWKDDVQL